MKKCAFCDGDGPMTKEHMMPEWLCSINRPSSSVLNKKANKIMSGDMEIRDVCSICNNVNLSKLDAYAKSLHDEYFSRQIRRSELVDFRFDYSVLLRWLLKSAYNSARIYDDICACNALKRYRTFILNGEMLPKEILLFCQIISTTIFNSTELSFVSEEARLSMLKDSSGRTVLMPPASSISDIKFTGNRYKAAICKRVSVNCFRFILLLPRSNSIVRKDIHGATRLIMSESKDICLLKPKMKSISINGSVFNARDEYNSAILANKQIIHKWLENRKKSTGRHRPRLPAD
jgi:hypothetical protein